MVDVVMFVLLNFPQLVPGGGCIDNAPCATAPKTQEGSIVVQKP